MRRLLLVVVVLLCVWGGVVSAAAAYTITLRGPSAVPEQTDPPWTGSLHIIVTVDSAMPFRLWGTDVPSVLEWFPGSAVPTQISAVLPWWEREHTVTAEIENGGPDSTHPKIEAVIGVDSQKPGVVAGVTRLYQLTTRSHIVATYWTCDPSSEHTRSWAVMTNASGRTVAHTAKTGWWYRQFGQSDYRSRRLPLFSSRPSGTFPMGVYRITVYAKDYGGNIDKDVVKFRVK